MFGKKSKEKNDGKTFRHEGVKLYRCPCGADQVAWVPNGRTETNLRMFSPMCAGCGEMITTVKTLKKDISHKDVRAAWNRHMIIRQNQEGGIQDNDTAGDEEE